MWANIFFFWLFRTVLEYITVEFILKLRLVV